MAGMLEDWLLQFQRGGGLPTGPGFAALDPTFNEPAMAQDAREVAAERLRRGVKRDRWGPFPGIVAPQIGMLSDLAAPQAPEMAPEPAPDVPLPRPRPADEPMDISAVARNPGAPMSLAPQMAPAAGPAAPQAPAASPFDGILERINDNRGTLLALAGGFAGAPSIGTGMRRAFSAAAPASVIDKQLQTAKQTRNETVEWLKRRGMSEADARTLAANPTLLANALKKPDVPAGYRLARDGNLEFIPGGPADPAVKRAQGDRQNAPPGYAWVDPENPKAGLQAIPGGPAEKVDSQVAARLGLAESFLGQLPQIRGRLAAGDATGPLDALQAKFGVGAPGELRRQIESGSEALLRNLTGAGMNMTEAEKYVKRYELEATDTIGSITSKMNQLERELKFTMEAVRRGRGGNIRVGANGLTEGDASPAGAPGALGVGQSRTLNGVTITRVD